MIRRLTSLLIVAAAIGVLLTLPGCGNKGPLYLPTGESAPRDASTDKDD